MAEIFDNIARSNTGRLRNLGAMSDKKFKAVLALSDEVEANKDKEGYAAIMAEAKVRQLVKPDVDNSEKYFESKRRASKSRQTENRSDLRIMKAQRFTDKKRKMAENGKLNPDDFLLSEKLDGFRAIWDGKEFRSKNGNVFVSPPGFRSKMPKGMTLDGEMWAGRDQYKRVAQILRTKNWEDSKTHEDAWLEMSYMVFDSPSLNSKEKKNGGFEKSIAKGLKSLGDVGRKINKSSKKKKVMGGIKRNPDGTYSGTDVTIDNVISVVPQIDISKSIQLAELPDGKKWNEGNTMLRGIQFNSSIEDILNGLVDKGSEGMMIRSRNSYFDPTDEKGNKRSNSILKIKPRFTEEALVIGYEEGLNRNEGKVGSLLMQSKVKGKIKTWKLGAGLTDTDRLNPPPKNTVVEYKFTGRTSGGLPKEAAFFRARPELDPRAYARSVSGRRRIDGRTFGIVGINTNKERAKMMANGLRKATRSNVRVIPLKTMKGYGLYLGPKSSR
tara:strand:- start:305 stop:1795 length:1491 start_codon:yes stop_codon:yes gene_type:complete